MLPSWVYVNGNRSYLPPWCLALGWSYILRLVYEILSNRCVSHLPVQLAVPTDVVPAGSQVVHQLFLVS